MRRAQPTIAVVSPRVQKNPAELVMHIPEITCSLSRIPRHAAIAAEISLCVASSIYLVSSCPFVSSIFPLIDFTKSRSIVTTLQAALSSPYPPGSTAKSPLKFDLEFIENAPPTAHRIRTVLKYLPRVRDVDNPHHVAALISSHPSAPSFPDRPHSTEGLVCLAERVRSHLNGRLLSTGQAAALLPGTLKASRTCRNI